MKWIFLGLAILCELIGTSALKNAEGFTRLQPSIVLIVSYAFAFYFLSLTLKEIPIGVAYALWSAIGIVLIAIVGYFLHGQKLDMPAIIGMGFIIIGVVIMQLFSKTISH